MELEILNLFKQGNSLSKISKQLNISRKKVTKVVKDANLPIPKHTYLYNDNVFENIDTEEKAYWLGFIYADGCIGKVRNSGYLEISLKGSDIEHLNKFALFICNTTRIVRTKKVLFNGKTYDCCRVTVNNTKIYSDLVALGLTERKSLTIKFPHHIETDLLRHFIRGYVDGNGCIYLKSFSINITTGSSDFLNSLVRSFNKELNVPVKSISSKKDSTAYTVYYYGENSQKILTWLYSDCNIALDRKYKNAFAVLDRNI